MNFHLNGRASQISIFLSSDKSLEPISVKAPIVRDESLIIAGSVNAFRSAAWFKRFDVRRWLFKVTNYTSISPSTTKFFSLKLKTILSLTFDVGGEGNLQVLSTSKRLIQLERLNRRLDLTEELSMLFCSFSLVIPQWLSSSGCTVRKDNG